MDLNFYIQQSLIEDSKDQLLEAYKDKLENEFKIDESNQYVKIIDESYEGSNKYFGIMNDECLIQ